MSDTHAPPSPVPAAAAKPWYASRTLWFNGAAAAIVAAEAGMGMLQPVLGDSAYAVLAFIVLVGNAVLRAVTTQPLTPPRALQALKDAAPW